MNSTRIPVSVSQKGFPCMWEKGGNGKSTIIANEYGAPKQALYVKNSKNLNSDHALVSVEPGDIIVEVKDKQVSVYKVKEFKEDPNGFSTTVYNDHQDKSKIIKNLSDEILRKRGIKAVEDSFTFAEQGLFIKVSYDYTQKYAVVELVGKADDGNWEILPPMRYVKAVEAAISKADDMACTEMYYAIPPRDKRVIS